MKVEFNLYELMAKKKIRTIKELEQQSGISQPVLSAMINGKKNFYFETVARLCNFFGCRIDELVTLKKEE
jgi:DNA-binding Xre family transcriptional regulator